MLQIIKSKFESSNTLISFNRVDPFIGTDEKKISPIQVAASGVIGGSRDSVELLTLFAELAQKPATMKIKLLKLIIESDGEQVASLDTFKQQFESLSASEVTSLIVNCLEDLDLYKFQSLMSKGNLLKL